MNDRASRMMTVVALALFFAVYIIDPTKKMTDPTVRMLARSAILRAAAILVFVCCVWTLRLALFARPTARHLAVFLPAMAVAINNFPWLPLATGSATLVSRADLFGWLVFHVLCVGILEELAFRGVLLPLLLRRFGTSRGGLWKSVILSSVIFGFVHLVNLIEGAGVAATLMQVGYSMLTGTLCAALLLRTGNLVYCVLFHAVFNFGGGVTAYLMEGRIWTVPNVLCTVAVGVAVGVWLLISFCRLDPRQLPDFGGGSNREADNKGD